tara:strand:+ start:21 stop:695 length:675 start_codon:yes stop_codon:yes gene_type:complete
MSEILKIGKYRGKTLNHVSNDINYSEWLLSQDWFKERYSEIAKELTVLVDKRKSIEITRDSKDIIVYTDGACSNNGIKGKVKRGGCGVYFNRRNEIELKDISKKLQDTYNIFKIHKYKEYDDTNNKAELMAICLALRECSELDRNVVLYTDSEYSIKAISEWYPMWESRGVTSSKKNHEMIKIIRDYMEIINVDIRYIRAHTRLTDENSSGNMEADKLACSCHK